MEKNQVKNKVLKKYNCIKDKKSTFVSVDKV